VTPIPSADDPLDPITLAVVKSALDAIVDEMAYTVIRTARSEIIKDVMDYSAALCDAEGRMIAQARTIAQHLGAIPDAMQSVLREFGGRLHPGDVVVMNDPYEGGMHIPDVFLFLPIFAGDPDHQGAEGDLEGFSVVIGHQTDMGGRVPGSNASDSTEIYQEGLRLPPVKLYERGFMSHAVRRIIERNVRVPDRVLGDLGAQYAACRVGERELRRLLARHGPATLRRYVAELLDYAERLTRAELARWPVMTSTFTDYLDSDGLSDDPVPLTVTITVHPGGHLTCDWTGSAPQVRAALNSTLSFTKSCTYLSVRSVLRQDAPNNAGVFRCIDVRAPEGTILNPRPPGACAARALTGYRMLDVMLGALARIVPDRVPAAGEGGNTVLSIGGLVPPPGQPGAPPRPFVLVDMITGAWGGRPDRDGMEAVTNPSQNMSNTPVEVLEAQHPIRIDEFGFVPDSCGAGKWRGGLGLRRRYTLLAPEATLQLRSDRMRFRPYGLAGGQPARGARNVLNPDGEARSMPAKFALLLRQGDSILHEQPGGGGFGDPLERDPEQVAADVRNEKITPAFALREHGVAVAPDTGEVDRAATLTLRAERRRPVAPGTG
jgi:N-methylhydantoinase B